MRHMASRFGSVDGRPTGPLPAGTQRVTAGAEVPGGRFLHPFFLKRLWLYCLIHLALIYRRSSPNTAVLKTGEETTREWLNSTQKNHPSYGALSPVKVKWSASFREAGQQGSVRGWAPRERAGPRGGSAAGAARGRENWDQMPTRYQRLIFYERFTLLYLIIIVHVDSRIVVLH